MSEDGARSPGTVQGRANVGEHAWARGQDMSGTIAVHSIQNSSRGVLARRSSLLPAGAEAPLVQGGLTVTCCQGDPITSAFSEHSGNEDMVPSCVWQRAPECSRPAAPTLQGERWSSLSMSVFLPDSTCSFSVSATYWRHCHVWARRRPLLYRRAGHGGTDKQGT